MATTPHQIVDFSKFNPHDWDIYTYRASSMDETFSQDWSANSASEQWFMNFETHLVDHAVASDEHIELQLLV